MIWRKRGVFILFMGLFIVPVWGHVPDFMQNYLITKGGDPLIMPGMSYYSEWISLLKIPPNSPSNDREPFELIKKMRARSLKSDLKDFADAMQGDPKAQLLVEQYTAMRTAMLAWVTRLDFVREQKQGWEELKEVPDVTFDVTQHEAFLAKIPKEFDEYVRGAYAYHHGDTNLAISHFDAILQLPGEQRKYRSTWASFMLGKIWMKKNPAKAFHYFEQTRELTKTGFSDALNFDGESLAWQARIDADNSRYVDAIHRYAECAQKNISADILLPSLTWVCDKIFATKKADPALVNDPLCREILIVALSQREKTLQDIWFKALEKCRDQGVVAGADRLAWIAYKRGDIKTAENWLKHGDLHSARAKWVNAKLLLRAGKLEEGVALLREVATGAKNEPDWEVAMAELVYTSNDGAEVNDSEITVPAKDYAAVEIGTVLLAKRNYIGAMDLFARAGFWPDAAYVAESLVPMEGEESLEQYLLAHKGDDPDFIKPDTQVSLLAHLRDILARRMARQGEWDKAAQYYAQSYPVFDEEGNIAEMRPAAPFAEEARRIAVNLKIANDTTQLARIRAKALFDTAMMIRKDGMELMGTELAPDWAIDRGEWDWHWEMTPRLEQEHGSENRTDDELKWVAQVDHDKKNTLMELPVMQDEVVRRMSTAVVPYRRFHYRYVAADMMWRCAQMLPNNDPLCAEALYRGGVCLQTRDPYSADKFYKALVQRNPNLAVAQEAKKLKWFPAKFTDKVLYHSPVQPIRKRILAMWGCGGLGLLALAVLLIYKRSRKGAASVQEKA